MDKSIMVVAIVFISVGFGVLNSMYKRHLLFKERNLRNQKDTVNDNVLFEKVEKLTQRVQVLEQIVTDEGYAVQKEIKHL